MAIQIGRAGAVAIGLPATATLDAAVTQSHLLYVDAFGVANTSTYYNSADAVTGYEMGRGHTLIDDTPQFTLSGPVTDTTIAILNAITLGTDVVTNPTSGAYQHLAVPVALGSELPFPTFYVKNIPINDGSSFGTLKFASVMVNSLTISCRANDVWRWSGSFMASSEGTGFGTDLSSLIRPAMQAVPFARTEFVYSTTNPTGVASDPGTTVGTTANYAGGVGSGWTNVDWTSALRDISITFNNNAAWIRGGASDAIAGLNRVQRSIVVNATFNYDQVGTSAFRNSITSSGSAVRGLIIRVVSSTNLGTGYNAGFEYCIPQSTVTAVANEATMGPRAFTNTYEVFNNGNAAMYDIYAYSWNGDSTDLVT